MDQVLEEITLTDKDQVLEEIILTDKSKVLEEIILTDKSVDVSVQLGFIFALGGFYHECVYNRPASGWSVESCMERYCVRT